MSLKAFQLLQGLSRQYRQQHETLSKEEIRKKINEIKYLSAQKKVPRITLRKEILHLENQLQGIFDLEQMILKEKRRESGKVLALKRQIQSLQQQLAVAENQDLQKKLDALLHLLAETAARKKVKEEIAAVGKSRRKKVLAKMEVATEDVATEKISRQVRQLQQRLSVLKQALDVFKLAGKDGQVQELERKAAVVEQKLQRYYDQHPELLRERLPEEAAVEVAEVEIEPPEAKHTILFGPPLPVEEKGESAEGEDLELEKELPLPPPPRMKK